MPADLGRFVVDRVIVHEVPSRPAGANAATVTPTLSEVESPLTPGLANFIREKIVGSLSTASFDVEFVPGTTSPVPALVADDLGARTETFVDVSRRIAQHLFDSQTGVNPPGLLIVVRGKLAGANAIALLKLEKETGARAHPTNIHGRATFRLEHLQDLMLTQNTKVFKAGLFTPMPNSPSVTPARVNGYVSDNQRGYRPTTAVADFFLMRFLGCQLLEAGSISTQKFFQVTELFINEFVRDPAKKARYHVALLAAMTEEVDTLNPRTFATHHLATTDRQPFMNFLDERGVQIQTFDKDLALVEGHLKRTSVDFESGIMISARPEVFEERIQLTDAGEGQTKLEMIDRIKQVKGK